MKAFSLPQPPETANIRALSQRARERFVPSAAATTLTLGATPVVGSEVLTKNGLVLDWGGTPQYTVAGAVVTLAVAASGTDVYLIDYYFRT